MCCAVLLLSVRVHRCLRNVFQPDGFWRIAYHTETYTHREPGHGFMHRQRRRRRPATGDIGTTRQSFKRCARNRGGNGGSGGVVAAAMAMAQHRVTSDAIGV